ncbi:MULTISPECIES: threonine-phosphate decarboxylase CobD [Rhizobium]|uniref:threonine-phosphate decarboxylase n=1 Tax=Rhizobium tropici TaxID=398 RepID=A0A6P1C5B8_RHITR|nr:MULTISPECIES: threonine-phosphate decarboxylase CobD [Rhizobium]AGB71495.1 threonine-phosphate decarboxylase [Rhizobium tropici CIAT 899]MBB4240142.1 cobalamin biosynthetic protein CobC [Rhizobium tropici]MBB5591412.1 cobalamin biosynthetic protein CobC [Rhizobium tropici]MBB6490504.1 cobalamin biosynthetic protein CobC [Rhizobium tropici]NEV10154.1 threonine-phosphate decarboxylase [Rhizobium tropici]
MTTRIVHGGGITAAARQYGGRPEEWLDLSTGINPNPVTLPEIPVAAWHRLPDQYLQERAREAARSYYRSGDILPLPVPGTQSVIQLLPKLVTGGSVAIFSPTYGEYARAFTLAGLQVRQVSTIAELTTDDRLVVAVNPNNPDGRVLPIEQLRELHDRQREQGGLLLVDEAFGDVEPAASMAPFAASIPNLIIFRSFGKFFGLAGLRLGFVIAEASILTRFEDWLGPWAVSGPALSIAASLMESDTNAIRNRILQRHSALEAVLRRSKLHVAGGTALFALVADDRAEGIYTHLCRHHILVRKFDYARNWLRFGLAPDEAADERLAGVFEDYST